MLSFLGIGFSVFVISSMRLGNMAAEYVREEIYNKIRMNGPGRHETYYFITTKCISTGESADFRAVELTYRSGRARLVGLCIIICFRLVGDRQGARYSGPPHVTVTVGRRSATGERTVLLSSGVL